MKDLVLGANYLLEGLRIIRRPGLRRYEGKKTLPTVANGLGTAIISTSRGVMTDREARASGQGGEVLCTVS